MYNLSVLVRLYEWLTKRKRSLTDVASFGPVYNWATLHHELHVITVRRPDNNWEQRESRLSH